MSNFSFTRLNPNLNLLPGIGFQHFIALWKAYNTREQIAQFYKFCVDFCTDALKRKFKFFLNTHLGFENLENIFAYFNLLGQGLFKNV